MPYEYFLKLFYDESFFKYIMMKSEEKSFYVEFKTDTCLICHMWMIWLFLSSLREGKRFMHGVPNTAAILYRLQCIDRLRQLPTLYVVSEWQAGRWNRNFLFPRHHLPSRSNPLQCFGLPANPSSPPMPIYMGR